jgi:HlyD family secretion protein
VSEAQLLEVKANLDYAKTQLSFTIITAPITGTILEKVAKKGEMVTTSNFGGSQGARSAAVTMADLTDLQVELDINEDDLPRITMGQNCEIRVDSYPNEAVRGVVDEIAPRADRQKATVQVKVKILEPPSFIRPEVNARVSFLRDAPVEQQEETPARDSLWVPRASIVQTEDGPAVYLVFEGRALLRSVMMGREGPLGFEITDGLLGDENIIVAPLDQITDGMSVAVGAAR